MMFGLTQQQYDSILTTVIHPLSKLNLQVYCFGSKARGRHSPFSDLDLMIEGKKTFEAEKIKSLIEEQLQNGNFPFKVDLVFFEDYADAYHDGYLKDRVRWT